MRPPAPAAGAAPEFALAEAAALRGVVVGPAAAIDDAYVVIEAGEIKAVRKTRPEGVRVHE